MWHACCANIVCLQRWQLWVVESALHCGLLQLHADQLWAEQAEDVWVELACLCL